MVLDRVARGELPEKLFKADMDRFLERDQEPSRRDGPGERLVLQRGETHSTQRLPGPDSAEKGDGVLWE